MTTKPKALRYRIRRNDPLAPAAPQPSEGEAADDMAEAAPAGPEVASVTPEAPTDTSRTGQVDSAGQVAAETDIDAIRREGLTGRQLRMARRIAQKHGLPVTSDFDAVRQLRLNGIDPFRRSNILELVVPDGVAGTGTAQLPGGIAPGAADGGGGLVPPGPAAGGTGSPGRVQLPQTIRKDANLPSTETGPAPNPAAERIAEITAIQRDIARRRRRNLIMLFTRLAVFVALPTLIVGWYFAFIATPMYATHSEFTVREQQSQGGGGGLGSLFSGTGLATQQDAISVQSFLISRDAYQRLEDEEGFKAHFSTDDIDALQRLEVDSTDEEAFALYNDVVRVSYDPTEGLLKMEVIAADAQTSERFSEALITYAEERVDDLTQRVREDAMQGARASYEEAEARRAQALQEWLTLQQELEIVDPVGETSVKTSQIAELESQRQQLQLELQTRLNVRRPNEAQVTALQNQIENIDALITELRNDLTAANSDGLSLATKNTELRLAEENYTFQTVMVQQALQQMETARIEANRQVSYLSLNVRPIAPDKASYPKAFENTVLAFLIFAGVYLMFSLTASILREQVSA